MPWTLLLILFLFSAFCEPSQAHPLHSEEALGDLISCIMILVLASVFEKAEFSCRLFSCIHVCQNEKCYLIKPFHISVPPFLLYFAWISCVYGSVQLLSQCIKATLWFWRGLSPIPLRVFHEYESSWTYSSSLFLYIKIPTYKKPRKQFAHIS